MTDERRREAWRLHVQEGMPVKAIAQALGVPVGTIKTWIHRERKAREAAGAPNDGAARETDARETDTRETDARVALCPPPPDRYGRPYISLIPGGAFARWAPCPRCNRPWPNPRWNDRDAGRRLVVGELPGDDEPRSRLHLYLLCKSCAEAGPTGELAFRQVVPIWRGGECVDCRRSRYETALFEYVDCSDGRMRCLEHAVRFWEYAGQVDPAEMPKECADCGQTQNLYWSEDGRVRCAKCRLRIWQMERQGSDTPGRGLPLGL
jgi:DNA-directed RNA polymerase subunit RPC12/RpoP